MPRSKTTGPAVSTRPIKTVAELEERLTEPAPSLIDFMAHLEGDLMILGVGGKMGLTLAMLAARARAASVADRKIFAVSTFSQPGAREQLDAHGIETIAADLLEPGALDRLPDAENVIYMVGRKFGSAGAEHLTWATNVYLPGLVGERYKTSRIVSFSTGAVYPHEPVVFGGSTERTPLLPVGEYAMSCIGRERMFDYYAREKGARICHYRLNYAVELRYGVLVDIALAVWKKQPVELAMGNLNCVWQGYANAVALQCLGLADSPARALNVTGPETVSVRWAATRLGEIMGRAPLFAGDEAPTSLLSNAAECHRLFGYPDVSLDTLVEWIAWWVMHDGALLDKPTHFAVRDGVY